MNHIQEDILFNMDISDESPRNHVAQEILMHYGMPRRSGRYPWGSGEDPYQHGSRDFLGRVEELRKAGFTYTDEKGKTWTGDNAIAKSMGLTSSKFRIELSIATNERKMLNQATARSLKEDGLNTSEIGRKMGVNESTVRGWLKENPAPKHSAAETAETLKKIVDEKKMVDVGVGVERELGVSKEKLNQALYLLEREGYKTYMGGIPQATNAGVQINQKVLCVPGTEHKEIYQYDKVHSIKNYEADIDQATVKKVQYPKSMNSDRLMIRYKDDVGPDGATGDQKDGIVEIRRGVEDLSLGKSRYAQVRILVDDTHYIKGMAVYSDDLPDGVDIVFNTNKGRDKSKLEVLKPIKDDPDNPFGSLIPPEGQSTYKDKNGKEQLSLINKRADQGDWEEWQNAVPSQFLGKQSLAMARKQLDLAKADKMDEFNDICALTNPTLKKHYLKDFAENCDSAAVHLKAAALPGQKYHVIIPVNSLTDNEVFAPNYENGTKLALIRYPHGGTFEIPILTVNNKNQLAKKIIGMDSIDAVGINKNIADRLSGADFDGDTVMAIPTHDPQGRVKITSTKPLEGLIGFDPKKEYAEVPGMKYMKDPKTGKDNTQNEMGRISNLITDMTLGGADEKELARAVRHSMVVIDAGKHKLNYKQSEIDNNIAALRKKYQPKYDEDGNLVGAGGAATILSKSKGEQSVIKKQGTPKVNSKYKKNGEPNPDYDPTRPEGALIYKTSDNAYYPVRKYNKDTGLTEVRTISGKKVSYNAKDEAEREKYEPVPVRDEKTGVVRYFNKAGDIEYRTDYRKDKSTRMAETDDAYTLVSKARHPMELLYADYANSMKDLANKARLEEMNTGKIQYSATAKATYAKEVKDLDIKLNTALLNATRERAAQRAANYDVQQKKLADPNMKSADIKKEAQRALSAHRNAVGSISRRDRNIPITDKEWEAIQAGAISETKLSKILNNTDPDKLRERAMPRSTTTPSSAKISKMKAMSSSNYSLEEIAKACGVSTSTVSKYLKGAN
jgi:transcriptional regulator with XRE-family HTH domain